MKVKLMDLSLLLGTIMRYGWLHEQTMRHDQAC
jgi:hypothetical protein